MNYEDIELFGCTSASELIMSPPNLKQKLEGNIKDIAFIDIKETFIFRHVQMFPPFITEVLTMKYKDGSVLNISFHELYSISFLFNCDWKNMMFVFSTGWFKSLHQIGLLISRDGTFSLYRKEYINQNHVQPQEIQTFGTAFRLSFLSYTSLRYCFPCTAARIFQGGERSFESVSPASVDF